jgi:hypothetical protein
MKMVFDRRTFLAGTTGALSLSFLPLKLLATATASKPRQRQDAADCRPQDHTLDLPPELRRNHIALGNTGAAGWIAKCWRSNPTLRGKKRSRS